MSNSVIKVEGLGKRYAIGGPEKGRETFREMLVSSMLAPIKRFRELSGDTHADESIWALKDVNFEVEEGKVVGIIGRNGAGKSTLLKILSRITEPTEGRIEIRGRVASLLEVGTGFHTELTGRENIYLSGAILGMSRKEIDRKFEEIVDFAGIEKFLDTSVKRYSSGMFVRLAFAVAAHLDPEILIVDEVLAVGDVEFQKKCLGKMDEVSKRGRTVLLVSHDLRKVGALCERGILLNAGRIEGDGPMPTILDMYLGQRSQTDSAVDLAARGDRSGSAEVQFQSLELLDDGQPCRTFAIGGSLTQRIGLNIRKNVGPVVVASTITTSDGIAVQEFLNIDTQTSWIPEVGTYVVNMHVDKLGLYPGTYSIDLWAGTSHFKRLDYITEALTFDIIQTPETGVGRALEKTCGLFYQPSSWNYHPANGR